MGWAMAAGAAGLALATAVSGAEGQRPRFGVGVTGGIFFGAQLADHSFRSQVGDREVEWSQQVSLNEVGVASAHVEWYATPHVALRVHGARGTGRLTGTTRAPLDGELDGSAFDTGFGRVRMSAWDAGISLWPFAPRGTGFAPFVTLGGGMVDYDFENTASGERFFLAQGARSRQALLVGVGADMLVWEGVTLRFEAMNHMVDSPIADTDFAIRGAAQPSSGNRFGGESLSNVRLVLGAHVYFPFVTGSLLER